jgi:hypothetical protein
VGEVEAAEAAQKDQSASPAENQAALTKEATAKSLLITLRRLQSLKEDKAALERRVENMQQELSSTQAMLDCMAQQREALLRERDELQTVADTLRWAAAAPTAAFTASTTLLRQSWD